LKLISNTQSASFWSLSVNNQVVYYLTQKANLKSFSNETVRGAWEKISLVTRLVNLLKEKLSTVKCEKRNFFFSFMFLFFLSSSLSLHCSEMHIWLWIKILLSLSKALKKSIFKLVCIKISEQNVEIRLGCFLHTCCDFCSHLLLILIVKLF
jgi:hypothetical protein